MNPTTCPKCSAPNRSGAKFCIHCGQDLTSDAPALQVSEPSSLPGKPQGEALSSLMHNVGNIVTSLLKRGSGAKPLARSLEVAHSHPDHLPGGYLDTSSSYQRIDDVAQHTAYFVAQNDQGQHVLICEVPAFPCDADVARTLTMISAELQHVQRLIDILCTTEGRAYVVLEHPRERWHFLSDYRFPNSTERALEWGKQIGQALDGLHHMGYALGEERRSGLEKVLIDGDTARLADLTTCKPLSSDPAQRHQAILSDVHFLARVLYFVATNRDLNRDLQEPKLAGLPRPLCVAISLGARGSYVSLQEMLEHLGGRNLPPLHLVSGKATHAGRVHDHNEDQYFVYEVSKGRSNEPLPAFYMVADGMGGHEAGEVASDTISAALKEWLDELSSRKSGRATQRLGELPEDALEKAIQEANAAVFRQARARGNNMGATVTAALVVGEQAFIANVGDSRTYMYRQGELERVTKDHSVVYSLAVAGQIEWDEIYTHPQRNQIYRNLGDKANVQVDVFTLDLQPGDRLLLCCDGLWEMVRDPQIADVLRTTANPQEACDRLVDAANRAGGEDNITAVLVTIE